MNYTYPQQQQHIPQQQNFGYRPQMWVTPQQATPQVRPVSSIEEVKAYPIDFDGSVFYFPDIANRKIYTKSINMDGTVAIHLYELKDIPIADHSDDSSYITRQEFEDAINQLKLMYEETCRSTEKEMSQNAAHQPQVFQF